MQFGGEAIGGLGSCKNAKEATELTKTHQFDVILMPIEVCETDGYEAANTIRSLVDQFQNIPIIGYGSERISPNGKGRVIADFILSPFNEVEL